jgi:hypothetical protein
MVMNVRVEDFLQTIPVNGGEVLDPSYMGPEQIRGLHMQEIIDAADRMGFAIVEIEALPRLWSIQGDLYPFTLTEANKRLEQYIHNNEGVLYGSFTDRSWKHAYAVSFGKIFNPDTGMECKPFHTFVTEGFYKVQRYEKQTPSG